MPIKTLHLNAKNIASLGGHPHKPYVQTIEGSKFFALLRILEDVPKVEGVQWLYIPNSLGVFEYLGFEVVKYPVGYKIKHTYATTNL